jgi:hypothetical protein
VDFVPVVPYIEQLTAPWAFESAYGGAAVKLGCAIRINALLISGVSFIHMRNSLSIIYHEAINLS